MGCPTGAALVAWVVFRMTGERWWVMFDSSHATAVTVVVTMASNLLPMATEHSDRCI